MNRKIDNQELPGLVGLGLQHQPAQEVIYGPSMLVDQLVDYVKGRIEEGGPYYTVSNGIGGFSVGARITVLDINPTKIYYADLFNQRRSTKYFFCTPDRLIQVYPEGKKDSERYLPLIVPMTTMVRLITLWRNRSVMVGDHISTGGYTGEVVSVLTQDRYLVLMDEGEKQMYKVVRRHSLHPNQDCFDVLLSFPA